MIKISHISWGIMTKAFRYIRYYGFQFSIKLNTKCVAGVNWINLSVIKIMIILMTNIKNLYA